MLIDFDPGPNAPRPVAIFALFCSILTVLVMMFANGYIIWKIAKIVLAS